jgi:L-threonylcarbamoyladenylate synthase
MNYIAGHVARTEEKHAPRDILNAGIILQQKHYLQLLIKMQLENDIENCLAVLRSGGLILYPTDTVWGIGCDATNEEAVERIFNLKERPAEKSMIILLADEKEIPNYVDHPNPMVYDYIKGISKPTTMIYKGGKNLAKNLLGPNDSVAIRPVNEPFCQKLIKKFGKPLVSTSPNISGFPTPMVFNDIDIRIKKGVDYIVQYRQDDDKPGEPSTIIRVNTDGSYDIVRN